MGEFKAGKWVLILVIYFAVLIIGLTLAENFATEYGLNYSITTNGNESLLSDLTISEFGECDQPRRFYNPSNGDWEELSFFLQENTKCEYTIGQSDLGFCNDIPGCGIVNETFLLFFTTGTQLCGGDVNFTDSQFYGQQINLNIYGEYSPSNETYPNLCSLVENQSTCDLLGCTWRDPNTRTSSLSEVDVLDTTGALFTFSATFTDNTLLDLILSFILFYIPLIMLIIAIYYMIPFLH